MSFSWQDAFTQVPGLDIFKADRRDVPIAISTLPELKQYLDWVHIRRCLIKPFMEHEDYPLVESRELLPSFESDPFEYSELPGFSMAAFERRLSYFHEVFQFDILHSLLEQTDVGLERACPLESNILCENVETFLNRLPKKLHESFRKRFSKKDVTDTDNYPRLLRFLLQMDRGHIMSLDGSGNFHLSGVYASFPSDLDNEIKRFGLQIKKFTRGDNQRYERNRLFVYQFLMELYGFPIVSERRTSAALFARRLFKKGESFLVRVLGQSDRTLTTMYSHPESRFYPRVEKIALVQVDETQREVKNILDRGDFFVDRDKRVVILRVTYKQHKFDPNNVRQDRALTVQAQEVIHPITGEVEADINIIKDTSNMFLRLNDIVRGEFTGRIVYKRFEVVENTETHDKRLKFLYSWLSKHQRRIIGYSDEFYAKVVKVLDNYLLNPDNYDVFNSLHELHQEVWSKYSYIQQARKVKLMEDLAQRIYKQNRIGYLEMLEIANETMHDLKFEIVNYFEELVDKVIDVGHIILADAYLVRVYISKKDDDLTPYGKQIKKNYGRFVSLIDEFKAIRKTRSEFLGTQQAV